jgi:hypothetical protein
MHGIDLSEEDIRTEGVHQVGIGVEEQRRCVRVGLVGKKNNGG